jgi:hypothetical protein
MIFFLPGLTFKKTVFSRAFSLFIVISLLQISFATHSYAQTSVQSNKPIGVLKTDTIIKLRHSPKRAALLSTMLPGLGQAYNKKYWKIPLVYAGLGTSIYFIIFNSTEYNKFHGEFVKASNADATHPYNGIYSILQLGNATEYYRRNRDLSYAITAGIYALNIIDATVDAHLFFFDISDQLSIHITPTWFNIAVLSTEKDGYIPGISLTLLVIK